MSRDYFQVRATIYVSPGEEAQLRADRQLGDGDSTRAALANIIATELDGIGIGHGWWHETSVH